MVPLGIRPHHAVSVDLLAAIAALTPKEPEPAGIAIVRHADGKLHWQHPTLGDRWNWRLIEGANYKGLIYRNGVMWPDSEWHHVARTNDQVFFDGDGGYPVERVDWLFSGNRNPTREAMIQHLLNGSSHRGEFPETWLRTLSNVQLGSVHDADHENRVQRQYVVGRTFCPT